MNKLQSKLHYIFSLDLKIRTWLRFAIETTAIILIYSFWYLNLEIGTTNGFKFHFINFVVWCFLYNIFGLQNDRLRFSSLRSYFPIFKISIAISIILLCESIFIYNQSDPVISLLTFLLLLNILTGLRILARQIIRKNADKDKKNILVYGVSDLAIDLVNAMTFSKKYNASGFISDVPVNINTLSGLPVIKLKDVETYAISNACQLVVLATPQVFGAGHSKVLEKFDKLGLSVSYAPTMDRAFDYEVQLKAVKPEEVLGRPSAIEFDDSLSAEVNDKTVFVTGAGGSIGSEICRQLLRYKPRKLVILEISEFALYTLEQELTIIKRKQRLSTQILYNLGSVTDLKIVNKIFETHKINLVYHAAAYKHVPILEENIVVGLINNVSGTKIVAEVASRCRVDKFVLVSTDKAIRPTNVMGASKRLAEFIIQNIAEDSKTIFTRVRFGNVLGSSGSVIPKFKSQIKAGGPVTVTHCDITRYFMSIPEAAHLVLNAGALAKGGEVFLLDMGEPVKITDLAKSMIRQHGLQPVMAEDLGGRKKYDNELLIEFTGLRPGEKLFEELLTEGVSERTQNPKIFRSRDQSMDKLELSDALLKLEKYAEKNDWQSIINLLKSLPLAYSPTSKAPKIKINDEAKKIEKKSNLLEGAQKSYKKSFLFDDQSLSFLQKVFSSAIGLSILHRYFLFSRGMTLGVRVLVQNELGEILLVKHSYIPGWHLPGGGVDHGENIYSAVRRELYEECGLNEVSKLKLIRFEHNSEVSKRDHVAFFTAKTSQSLNIMDNFEIENACFFELKHLPPNLDKTALQCISELRTE